MKKLIFILPILLLTNFAFSQKTPYKIYNAKGKKVSYKKMLKTLQKNDIVLFGEIHDNAIAHWLEYELTSDLHKTDKLILGAEMIETDNQSALDNYIQGEISYSQFDSLARLWTNYETDYAPLVNFAIENKLTFIASNIPRKYANLVYRKGFDALNTLTPEEKQWMAPLPIPFDSELPTYKKILVELGDHGSPALVKAQAIKDATMAHFILSNYKKDHLFLHFNGSFHSDYYEGINWYIEKANTDLNIATISTVTQESVHKLLESNKGLADFIICVDENMTTTY